MSSRKFVETNDIRSRFGIAKHLAPIACCILLEVGTELKMSKFGIPS
jgi:hypothetical protein